jgi:hypothetical protein
MTIEELKLIVGEKVYRKASDEARESAPGTGTARTTTDVRVEHAASAIDKIISAVLTHTWSETSDRDLVSFFANLYREIPTYGLLYQLLITRKYEDLDPGSRAYLWAFFRDMLSSEDNSLADPVAYSIWCDFFETNRVNEAWSALVTKASGRLLERVLLASGPVPFRLKRDLYAQLIEDERWHFYIYRSLLYSQFDVYGQIDLAEARGIFNRLSLPSNERDEVERLSSALATE